MQAFTWMISTGITLPLCPVQCYGSVAEIETFGKGCAGRDVGIFFFFCPSPFKLHLNAVDSAMSLNERPMVFTLQLMPMCNLWDSLMVSYFSHHLWCVSCFFIGRVSDRDLAGAVESPHELPACQLHQSPTSQNPCHFWHFGTFWTIFNVHTSALWVQMVLVWLNYKICFHTKSK